jgi:class 3 adenylate cyclase
MERKLTAILSADVQGYSRLMGDNEEMTIRTLLAYRQLMTHLIEQYRGRVVDDPGDNLLAEFASVVEAVQCAVAMQRLLSAANVRQPPNRAMAFRIGLNLGDVVVVGGRLYGEGINLAARVETLAEGGGICLSGAVYEQVVGKLPLAYEDLGERRVKNIDRPVRVYRVRLAPTSTAVAPYIEKPLPRWQWLRSALALGALLSLLVAAVVLKTGGEHWQRGGTLVVSDSAPQR